MLKAKSSERFFNLKDSATRSIFGGLEEDDSWKTWSKKSYLYSLLKHNG